MASDQEFMSWLKIVSGAGQTPPGLKFCTEFLVFSVVWQGPSIF